MQTIFESQFKIILLFQAVLDGRQGPSLQFSDNGGVSAFLFSYSSVPKCCPMNDIFEARPGVNDLPKLQ